MPKCSVTEIFLDPWEWDCLQSQNRSSEDWKCCVLKKKSRNKKSLEVSVAGIQCIFFFCQKYNLECFNNWVTPSLVLALTLGQTYMLPTEVDLTSFLFFWLVFALTLLQKQTQGTDLAKEHSLFWLGQFSAGTSSWCSFCVACHTKCKAA